MLSVKPEDLVKLSNELISVGYNVRRHCCEYYVGDFEKFICIIAVFSWWKEIYVYKVAKEPLPKNIIKILTELAEKYDLKLIIKDLKPELM